MDRTERARHIIHHVLSMDDRWGKPGDPRSESSDTPSRIISDESRWYAQLTREDHTGSDSEPWDVIQVYAYGQLRMTAAFRGDQVDVRKYGSGPWEPLFNLFNLPELAPLRSNHDTEYEM